jgi:hypothetical protein
MVFHKIDCLSLIEIEVKLTHILKLFVAYWQDLNIVWPQQAHIRCRQSQNFTKHNIGLMQKSWERDYSFHLWYMQEYEQYWTHVLVALLSFNYKATWHFHMCLKSQKYIELHDKALICHQEMEIRIKASIPSPLTPLYPSRNGTHWFCLGNNSLKHDDSLCD